MKTLIIKTLTQKEYKIELQKDITVDELKEIIEVKSDIPSYMIRVFYAGKQLQDGRTLSEYNVQDNAVMNVAFKCSTVSKTYEQFENNNVSESNQDKKNHDFCRIGVGIGIVGVGLPGVSGFAVASYFVDSTFIPSVSIGIGAFALGIIAGAAIAASGVSRSR